MEADIIERHGPVVGPVKYKEYIAQWDEIGVVVKDPAGEWNSDKVVSIGEYEKHYKGTKRQENKSSSSSGQAQNDPSAPRENSAGSNTIVNSGSVDVMAINNNRIQAKESRNTHSTLLKGTA